MKLHEKLKEYFSGRDISEPPAPRKACDLCLTEILDGEDFAMLNGTALHVCCYAYHLAFEVDNTMMCLGVAQTSAFEKARKSFQKAFMMTLARHCQHRKDWKAWPYCTDRMQPQGIGFENRPATQDMGAS